VAGADIGLLTVCRGLTKF